MPKPLTPYNDRPQHCDRPMVINQKRNGKVTQWRCPKCGYLQTASGSVAPGAKPGEAPPLTNRERYERSKARHADHAAQIAALEQTGKRVIKYALVDDRKRSESGLLTQECMVAIVYSNSPKNAARGGCTPIPYSRLNASEKRWLKQNLERYRCT